MAATRIVPDAPAEVVLTCSDLAPTLRFFLDVLGFRIETIFPADAPEVATLSGHGLRLRLDPVGPGPGLIRLTCPPDAGPAQRELIAPNGTRVELIDPDAPLAMPDLTPDFTLARRADTAGMGAGRAGMLYRDLIPGRLGGRFIASHIVIPQAGPVADWVHYHRVRFQMIYCRKGWVRVVYEDQGEPFVLAAGDCVLQPPEIRHRVLESSAGLEVVEIGCPARHETLADHDMQLPTGHCTPDRNFGGQHFLRHIAEQTPWQGLHDTGFVQRDTGMSVATRGLAAARVIKPAAAMQLKVAPHQGELMFGFVLEGRANLECRGTHRVDSCDAFTVPAGEPWGLTACSPDFALLQVTLPAS